MVPASVTGEPTIRILGIISNEEDKNTVKQSIIGSLHLSHFFFLNPLSIFSSCIFLLFS